MPNLQDFLYNTGSEAVGAGMGLLLGDYNDRRQLDQQAKLQRLQMQGQKEMSQFNMDQQYAMWLKTNYPGQVQQMQKAGINPGLMYGMGGGGGQTTGSPAANVTGAEAPKGGGEIPGMMGMALQTAAQTELLKAQKENIEADTTNKKATAAKTAGVDTEAARAGITRTGAETQKIGTEITDILQGIENKKAQQRLTQLQSNIAEMQYQELEGTIDNKIKSVEYQTGIAMRNLQLLDNEQKLKAETYDSAVLKIRQEAINSTILAGLMTSEIGKNISQIQLNELEARLKNLDLTFYADRLSLEKLKVEIQRQLKDFETDPVNQVLKNVTGAISTILGAGILKGTQQPGTFRPITGFERTAR